MADIIPPRRGEQLTPEGKPTTRFAEYLERLTNDANDSTDNIDLFDSIDNSVSSIAGINKQIQDIGVLDTAPISISVLTRRIKDLEILLDLSIAGQLSGFEQKLKVVTISSDYTSNGNEIIICNNLAKITVTMTESPANGSRTYIKRVNAIVDVTATKGIDGKTTRKITNKYDSPLLVYTSELDEYSII